MIRSVITTITVTSTHVHSDQAYRVTLADDGAGCYVRVETGEQEIGIDPDEWPALRRAIDRMVRIAQEQPE